MANESESQEAILLEPSKKAPAAQMLARAFMDDPIYTALFDEMEREKALRRLFGGVLGYNLTPELKELLLEVGVDAADWHTAGIQPDGWPDFGSVQKTSSEFRNAYDAFAEKCVNIAKEVASK